MRATIPLICAMVLTVACSPTGSEPKGRTQPVTGGVSIGQPAPEISGKDLDGTEFKLSDYRGKVVMLDFWGDW